MCTVLVRMLSVTCVVTVLHSGGWGGLQCVGRGRRLVALLVRVVCVLRLTQSTDVAVLLLDTASIVRITVIVLTPAQTCSEHTCTSDH